MRQKPAGEVPSAGAVGLPGSGGLNEGDRAGRILSLYDAILASAVRMREHASRLDMASFHREAESRERLIEQLAVAWASGPGDEDPALVAAARAATERIVGLDAETARAVGQAREDLARRMVRIGRERECMSSYRASAGRAGDGPRFVDRTK